MPSHRRAALFLMLLLGAAAPAAASSLRFYGHGIAAPDLDRVKIPIDAPAVPADVGSDAGAATGDFTLEFWMKANAGENGAGACISGSDGWINGNIIFDRDVYNDGDYGDYGISLFADGLAFGVARGANGDGLCGTTDVADGQWHHVAATRAAGALALWVDGAFDGTSGGPTGDVSYRNGRSTPFPNDPFLVIGAEKHDAGAAYPSYSGWIDEVRLSTVVRYGAPFTPPAAPLASDAATAALYHLDEGAGNVVGDASGAAGGPSDGVRQFGGDPPAGPEWSSDTPYTGPTPTPTGPTPTPTATATPACGAAPAAGCRTPAVPQKATLTLRDAPPGDDDKDQLAWAWLGGAVTPLDDFGDPLATTSYALCLYDGAGFLGSTSVPAGGTCAGKPCWKAGSTSIRYADRDRTSGGIGSVLLKEGLVPAKARILVKGKGALLAMPALAGLTSPVTVQLTNGATCWEAVYSFPPALTLDPDRFRDRAD
jgi:hypothetical protein